MSFKSQSLVAATYLITSEGLTALWARIENTRSSDEEGAYHQGLINRTSTTSYLIDTLGFIVGHYKDQVLEQRKGIAGNF